MKHLYTTYSEQLERTTNCESAKRMLKKLKIALTIWTISFLAILVWITLGS